MTRLLFAPSSVVPAAEIRAFGQLTDHFFRIQDDPTGQVYHCRNDGNGVHLVAADGNIMHERWKLAFKQKRLVDVIDPTQLSIRRQPLVARAL